MRDAAPVKMSLSPLSDFYASAGWVLPEAECIGATDVPEPYRRLLVHESDMTSTLERFFEDRVRLLVLEGRTDSQTVEREVSLVLENAGRPVEFGAIRIFLEPFPAEAQSVITKGEIPLGGILQQFGIPFVSAPRCFFQIGSDEVMQSALGLRGPAQLYGRCNRLFSPDEKTLAEIVEILPPLREPHAT